MKKVIFAAMALSLVFVACNKEEVETTTQEDQITETTVQNKWHNGDGRTFFSNRPSGGLNGNGEGCEKPGTDCSFSNIVSGPLGGGACIVGPMVIDNEMWLDDEADVSLIDYITENFDEIGEYIDATLLDAVISGELILKRSGTYVDGEAAFLKFVNAEDINVMVYPVIVE